MTEDFSPPTSEWYHPTEDIIEHANVPDYEAVYAEAQEDLEAFWAKRANTLEWHKMWDKVLDDSNAPFYKWFVGAKTNIVHNALDRHTKTWRRNKLAFIWEGENGDKVTMSYWRLWQEVNKFANVLRSMGVKKGDRVTIYMGRVPEIVIAMLACAKIGAPHSVVYGGFSDQALADRIADAQSRVLVTADGAWLRGKIVHLKDVVDEAVRRSPVVDTVIVVKRTGHDIQMEQGRDYWYHDLMALPIASRYCETEVMDAEDPLFILYTSGSTGQPKGVVHTQGGYLVWAAMTHELTFDYHRGDVFWCTADVGWVTGHSYIVYGPLANGATTLMFEGVPTYPDAGRFWAVCEKHKVNQFYTAPTAIRALMGQGNDFVEKYDLSDIKVLGTVGEPINPEAWNWYNEVVGKGNCPIVDTFWQTETGGHLITPLPGAIATKPGSATKPFIGVQPVVLETESGKEITTTEASGVLALKDSWPGQMRTVWGDHDRFQATYFQQYKGYYFTGDGCRRDADGYYWITGRVDDVINVSGHRMGTAEVESALVAHSKVAEAAVVGYPHDIKGQGIYAYVTLMTGEEPSDELRKELEAWVRAEIGPIAKPDLIQWAPGLPKTRSGKIMRRILRKIAENDYGSLGDTSTLADPSVVDDLIENRRNR